MTMKVVLGTGVLIASALALAACGTQGGGNPTNTGGTAAPVTPGSSSGTATGAPTLTPQATQTTPAATPTGPDRCHSTDLSASLGGFDAGAGNRYAVLTLTNRSGHTCVIFGYGGVGLLNSAKKPVPTKQVRDTRKAPVRVTLKPGAGAKSQLHWSVIPSGSENQMGPCEPVASFLQVIPPDEKQPITVAFPPTSVCQQGRIDQGPYQA
jgi:Domain of unknown function (DUF4232)